MTKDLEKEVAKLRKEVDAIKAKLAQKSTHKRVYATDWHEHIEELDKQLKQTSIKIKKNNLIVGQQVESFGKVVSLHTISPGTIQHIACKLALPSIKQCDKATCKHEIKNFVWVEWANKKTFAYYFDQLRPLSDEDLKPKIGKELSGRIGEWTYDADKKIWKKDGDDKEYTISEFEDYIYFEQHPYAKDEGKDFLRLLKMEQEHSKEVDPSK